MKFIDELAITLGITFLTYGLNLNIAVGIGSVLLILGIINRVTK